MPLALHQVPNTRGAGGVVRKLVAGRMLRSLPRAACTAFAIWSGPETYEESITVDNTSDGAIHAAAMPLHG